MTVIVEGFYKPKNCFYCPFNKSNCFCILTNGGHIDRDNGSCSATCPIKELPKGYGRLIDADATIKELRKMKVVDEKDKQSVRFAIIELEYAQTIIEADRAESEEV